MAAVNWTEMQRCNAHVTDGTLGFWAEFPPGTTAREVLEAYMSTADYSGATRSFWVEAAIDGQLASVRVGPGGVVQS